MKWRDCQCVYFKRKRQGAKECVYLATFYVEGKRNKAIFLFAIIFVSVL